MKHQKRLRDVECEGCKEKVMMLFGWNEHGKYYECAGNEKSKGCGRRVKVGVK